MKKIVILILGFSLAYSQPCQSLAHFYESNMWYELDSNPFSELKDKDVLFALVVRDGNTEIIETPISLVKDLDEGGIKISVEKVQNPVGLFSKLEGISSGKKHTSFSGLHSLGTEVNSFKLSTPQDEKVKFFKDTVSMENQAVINLVISYKSNEQIIVSSIQKEKNCGNELPLCANGSLSEPDIGCHLKWAGDLDNDNELDFILSLSGYGWSNQKIFLSSFKKDKELVGLCK